MDIQDILKSTRIRVYHVPFQIQYRNIDAVIRRTNGQQSGTIIVRCKNLKVIALEGQNADDLSDIADSLEKLLAFGIKRKNVKGENFFY